jgi:hypothetical protein
MIAARYFIAAAFLASLLVAFGVYLIRDILSFRRKGST